MRMDPIPGSISSDPSTASADSRAYLLEQVDDAAVVQIYADGFRELSLKEKTLVWHLYQAALAGRDIFYDQRYAHNLAMRDVLEAILTHPPDVPLETLLEIVRYTKLFWINTGPYNNLTARKFVLRCGRQDFAAAARAAAARGAEFPLRPGETLDEMLERLAPFFFDEQIDPTITVKTPPDGGDILRSSANNLYADVSMKDLESFTERHALNSRLARQDGRLVEEVYRIGGRYDSQIRAIIEHLTRAIPFAAPPMAAALQALIQFYRSGETSDREAYDIAWVRDKASSVDTINGFVEVYLDARSMKGAWEGLVFYVNRDRTSAMQKLAREAQWFEERMPWDRRYRREGAWDVTANAIDVVIEVGDAGPVTSIGINLPNDQTVRERHGSKSVSLSNVIDAYEQSMPAALHEEFAWSPDEIARAHRWSAFASDLTTNMHEVIGHGSGKVDERLNGNPQGALKEQFSTLEESRADLVALYFLPDPKLVEIGLVAEEHHRDVVLAEYEGYARRAISQLRRIRFGTQIEEDHMRNRQLIVRWLIANTSAIDVRGRDGKTYYVLTDAEAFREGVARLLAEVQRIKAEGDYEGAKRLVETYGVEFEPRLRDEVLARVEPLNLPSYTGFVMPKLEAVEQYGGEILDVTISYPRDLTAQMLEYSDATRALR